MGKTFDFLSLFLPLSVHVIDFLAPSRSSEPLEINYGWSFVEITQRFIHTVTQCAGFNVLQINLLM